MKFLERIFGKRGAAEGDSSQNAYHLYVRCDKCGAAVHTRIDLRNDLSLDDEDGYTIHKTLVDDRCFQRMEASLRFDSRKRLTEQQVVGGQPISHDEYQRLKQTSVRPFNQD